MLMLIYGKPVDVSLRNYVAERGASGDKKTTVMHLKQWNLKQTIVTVHFAIAIVLSERA